MHNVYLLNSKFTCLLFDVFIVWLKIAAELGPLN